MPCTLIHVEAVGVPDGFTRTPELRGLVAGLLEWRLASLDGVIPRVADAPISPGLSDAVLEGASSWTLSVELVGSDADLGLVGTRCDTSGNCVQVSGGGGTHDHPGPAIDALVASLAQSIGLLGNLRTTHGRESEDGYAILIAGRSAATFYGWLPAPEEEARGDNRRDVYRRALYIDPTMPLAAWIAGREAHRRGELETADALLRAARERVPGQLSLVADELAAHLVSRPRHPPTELIQQLAAGAPQDARFLVVRSRAMLASGLAADAEALLLEVPDWALRDPRIAALRVATADALRLAPDVLDTRLTAWAAMDPQAQEPIRRRARLAVDEGRFTDALPFANELATRGAAEEAARLGIAIETALGRFEQAATRAHARGDRQLATSLRARTVVPPTNLDDASPAALLAVAQAMAEDGRRSEAVELAQAARAAWGDHADAWRALADVLKAARDPGAAEALAAAERLDPAVLRAPWPPPPRKPTLLRHQPPTGH